MFCLCKIRHRNRIIDENLTSRVKNCTTVGVYVIRKTLHAGYLSVSIKRIYLTNVYVQKIYGSEEDKLFQRFNRNVTHGVNSRYGNLSPKFTRVYYKLCRCNKFARRVLRLKAFIICNGK